jgi:hypothetical protein
MYRQNTNISLLCRAKRERGTRRIIVFLKLVESAGSPYFQEWTHVTQENTCVHLYQLSGIVSRFITVLEMWRQIYVKLSIV